MAKRKRKKKQQEKTPFPFLNILIGIVLILISLFGIVPFYTGGFGNIIRTIFLGLFGTIYILPLVFLFGLGLYLILEKQIKVSKQTIVGTIILVLVIIVIFHNLTLDYNLSFNNIITNQKATFMSNFKASFNGGELISLNDGLIGTLIAYGFYKAFSLLGSYIVLVAIGVFSLILITNTNLFVKLKLKKKEKSSEDTPDNVVFVKEDKPSEEEPIKKETVIVTSLEQLDKAKEEPPVVLDDIEFTSSKPNEKYTLPSADLLSDPLKPKHTDKEVVNRNIKSIEQVLGDFGINGKTVAVTEGPAVTQYELELQSGTKVNKLTSLTKEISLALAKKDVRIVAPIPGKSTVGIELPNDQINPVYFKEVFVSMPTPNKTNKLLVALGKDIKGKPIYYDIDKTPHLLVAGATGSGKSVCINSIISSLIMRSTPDEVKLVLIDPKKVEFTMYNDLPHLLTPVVTDPKKANVALQKIVNEMDKRYTLLSEAGVKNITGYNEYVEKRNKKGKETLERMPFIVVIIDELADLMIVASKEVEDSIMRITQMARAAGIHLIVATQRPSTDIITGIVKANIPSRISFAVSSSIDSRTILDQTGAEKLLGQGDMLFLPMGQNAPNRLQGTYVSDKEVERLVNFSKQQRDTNFSEEFKELPKTYDSKPDAFDEEYEDPLYDQIYDFALEHGTLSASLLQRRYRIGFTRAARIIDLLEERGIVGPQQGSKPREVLITQKEE